MCLLFGYPQLVYQMCFGVNTNGYGITENAVYYNGVELHGVDRTSFTAMEADGRYARDEQHAYHEDKVIEGADGASFELLSPSFDRDSAAGDARDKESYYLQGKVVRAE